MHAYCNVSNTVSKKKIENQQNNVFIMECNGYIDVEMKQYETTFFLPCTY